MNLTEKNDHPISNKKVKSLILLNLRSKKMIKRIGLMLGLGLWIGLACSEDPMERHLQGKWRLDDYRINYTPLQLETERMQEEIQKMKKNSYFIFYPNYDYEVNLNGNTEKGKWRIDPKTKQLITQKINTNFEIALKIDTLNSQKLVFSSTRDSITTQISFTKEQ